MKSKLILSLLGLIAVASIAATAVSSKISETTDSLYLGRVGDKLAFFGGTAVVRPSGASQAATTATVGAALATTAATTSTPYGFSQAQADGLIARVNALIVDNAALITEVNALRTALVNLNAIKGGS